MMAPTLRVVSGGQSGVDRAALDTALELGIACGGWCPKGRWAEDGEIPARYPLRETVSRHPSRRTRDNVRDSDATLVLTDGAPTGGTLLTVRHAGKLGRPYLHVDFATGADIETVRAWIADRKVETLNVAGPRESKTPGIYALAHGFLVMALAPWARHAPGR